MSRWVNIKVGDVELVHHSTSSTIEIKILEDKELDLWQSLYMDYYEFSDLKLAIQRIDN